MVARPAPSRVRSKEVMATILLKHFCLPGLAFGIVATMFGMTPGPWWVRLWTVVSGFAFAFLFAWVLSAPPPKGKE
jgi:uncharacterized membrane protein